MTSPMPITGLKSAFERRESGVSRHTTKCAEEPKNPAQPSSFLRSPLLSILLSEQNEVFSSHKQTSAKPDQKASSEPAAKLPLAES